MCSYVAAKAGGARWGLGHPDPGPPKPEKEEQMSVDTEYLLEIAERLRTQDNRITCHPMFCVQRLIQDDGYAPEYATDTVWINMHSGDYEECDADTPGAVELGYKLRWETVMVAFTEAGCNEYMCQNGHNVKAGAHEGKTRIYAESFYRCPEMIAIRKFLLAFGLLHGEAYTPPEDQPCPFCGVMPEPYDGDYCVPHAKDCFLNGVAASWLVSAADRRKWNTRYRERL